MYLEISRLRLQIWSHLYGCIGGHSERYIYTVYIQQTGSFAPEAAPLPG